jgi:uncharacterized protein
VPKRSTRRSGSRTGAVIALAALVVFAFVAGRALLRPRLQPPHRRVAAVAASPLQPPPPTLAPALTPSPAPSESPVVVSPSPSPSPATQQTPAASAGSPRIALIVDDCGQWIATERGFLALGIPLTMSVLPDVPYTGEIAREASDAGKGVMLHLPMETLSGLNPGPGKVTTAMSDSAIVAQVQADLDQVPLAGGVNNHEGSKASADGRVMRDVIGVLAKRGDFFIDSRTSPASVGEQTAQALGVPTAARDVFLDNRADVAYTEAQLLEAAEIAKRHGTAIAIGHPRPTTLEAVRDLIPRLEASGVQFVLARDVVAGADQ